MRRREFIKLLGGVAAWPLAANAEQKQYRVAVLTPALGQWQPRVVRETLTGLGYREGVNLQLDVISADGALERLPFLAKQVIGTVPDVIVAVNTPGTRAAAEATSTIPIVSAAVGDPVRLGIVKSMARPEGNVTGIANLSGDITSKRIALLKEIAPSARRFALFMHPEEPIVSPQLEDVERSAGVLGIEYRTFPMRTTADLHRAFQTAIDWNAHAVVRLAGQGFTVGAETGRRATELRLPSMLQLRQDVEAGGLMSYFADHREIWRRVAVYVDRILKGASPQSLPFELPTRFELVLNIKTAKMLGLTVPPGMLAIADEVIE
jgi:putative tryptophan/tyrosine transport system substrate-binding protein